MIKGGSLIFALFVMTILSIITGFFILAYSYYNRIVDKWYVEAQYSDKIYSVLTCVTADYKSFKSDNKVLYSILSKEKPDTRIKLACWGGYYYCSLTLLENSGKEQSFLLGAKQEQNITALWLSSKGSKLNISGNSIVKGTCYLPGAVFSTNKVENFSFTGISPSVRGLKSSERELPNLNEDVISFGRKYLDNQFAACDSVVFINDLRSDSLENIFSNKTLVIYNAAEINLYNIKLSGNIIVKSDKKISISKSAQLTNVIIIAPEVCIEENVKGQFQVFASKDVDIKKGACLEYPSFVALINSVHINNISITMDSNSSLSGGLLLFLKAEKVDAYKALIDIKKDTRVEGQIYSSADVQLSGSVYGSIFCSRILLETPAAVYSNTLLNSTIDGTKLPDFYLMPFLIDSQSTNVLVWLN